jgi:hypothetical protein
MFGVKARLMLAAVVAGLAGTACAHGAGLPPVLVQPGVVSSQNPEFAVGREVACSTNGRRLTVHIPLRGGTAAQFRTASGTKVLLLVVRQRNGWTHIMCGSAKALGQ